MIATAIEPPRAGRQPVDPSGDVDRLIDPLIDGAIAALEGQSPLLPGMARYHLGLVDRWFQPVSPGSVDRGKRIRPGLALLTCAAAGGNPADAAPLAAAIELLHNFTLVHDDIQDCSPTRRHRPTVWSIWGVGQAINAGDALFAAAQLAVLRLADGAAPATVLDLAAAFNRMTIEIVAGQVVDLAFEGRPDVTPDGYLRMIDGKTAAIVDFAARGGARLGGASPAVAAAFGGFGRALGVGFQIRDDLLGIWGAPAQTGKAAADDIRRRKQSLPILLLRQRAADRERAELDTLYAAPEIDDAGTSRVLDLLDRHDVRSSVESEIHRCHDEASAALDLASPHPTGAAHHALLALVASLAARQR